jgi:hypothetical protein
VDGQFADWKEVAPEFRDTIGDPMRRDHADWSGKVRLVDQTGRNDIVAAKATADAANLYFYVRTREPLTPCTDPSWMLLYLNVDANPTNGWLGYDFVVNRTGVTARQTTVERCLGGNQWGNAKPVSMRYAGSEMEMAIPLASLGLRQLPAFVDFKWADNASQAGDWTDFILHGDVAPNDRYNYRAVFSAATGK